MSVRSSVFASDYAMREKGGGRRSFAGWLHTLAFAIWLGGLIAIGAFVAPNAARVIHSYSAFSSDPYAQQAILIGIIGNSFRLFNYATYVCAGIMIICDLLQGAGAESDYKLYTFFRFFLTVLLLGSSLYLGYYLFPHMDIARARNEMHYFDHLHKQYVLISEIQILPLVVIPALTAKRDSVSDSRY